MSINPYQPPERELPQSARRSESNDRHHRRLVSLGRVLLLAYNIDVLYFMTLFSIGLPLQILGRRGLPVPEFISECVAFLMIPLIPLHILLPFGNLYVFGLTLWLLAQRRREWGWLRRVLFAVLLFVPVWGLRRYRLFLRSDNMVH